MQDRYHLLQKASKGRQKLRWNPNILKEAKPCADGLDPTRCANTFLLLLIFKFLISFYKQEGYWKLVLFWNLFMDIGVLPGFKFGSDWICSISIVSIVANQSYILRIKSWKCCEERERVNIRCQGCTLQRFKHCPKCYILLPPKNSDLWIVMIADFIKSIVSFKLELACGRPNLWGC